MLFRSLSVSLHGQQHDPKIRPHSNLGEPHPHPILVLGICVCMWRICTLRPEFSDRIIRTKREERKEERALK